MQQICEGRPPVTETNKHSDWKKNNKKMKLSLKAPILNVTKDTILSVLLEKIPELPYLDIAQTNGNEVHG
jgi:hypothetical protein